MSTYGRGFYGRASGTYGTLIVEHERAAAASAIGTVAGSGQRVVERAAAIAASGSTASAGLTETPRSAQLNAATSIAASGIAIAVHERAAALAADATIAAAGEFWSIFERSAQLAASGQVAGATQRILVRQASASAAAGLSATGRRDLNRHTTVAAGGDVQAAGQVTSGRPPRIFWPTPLRETTHEPVAATSGTVGIVTSPGGL